MSAKKKRKGKIIAIANNKGGTSKTSSSVNLSHAHAKMGYSVLLIDNDAQCNSTRILLPDEKIGNSLYDIYDLDDDIKVQDCIYQTQYEGMDIIPNSAAVGATSIKILQKLFVDNDYSVLNILRDRIRDYVVANYDFTIIDNPPSLDTYVVCALCLADYVIIPNDSGSRSSFEGIGRACQFVNEIKAKRNPNLKLLKILTVKLDRRTSISRRMHDQSIKYFGQDLVFNTPIPINTDVQKAEENHQTIYQQRSNSPAAIAYMEVAKEILSYLDHEAK